MAKSDKDIGRETAILDAAATLIARYGYDKTTVEEIARGAGISKGAVYLGFKSKEALFDALVLRESERVTFQMFERLAQDPQGITLFTLFKQAMLTTLDNPLMKALMTDDRGVIGDYAQRMRTSPNFQQGYSFGVDFIRHFQAMGMLRADMPPEMMAYLISAVRSGIFAVADAAIEQPSIEAVGEAMAEMLDRAFGVPGAKDNPAARDALMRMTEGAFAALRKKKSDE